MAARRVAVSKYNPHHASRAQGYSRKKVEQLRAKIADPWHNTASAAAYLGCSEGLIKKLVLQRDIDSARLGRAVRIRQSVLDRYTAERTIPARRSVA